MSELYALVSPAAFLVTNGTTHEITRCYWDGKNYAVSSDFGRRRVGEHTPVQAEIRNGQLTVHFDTGYVVVIPANRVSYSYRV